MKRIFGILMISSVAVGIRAQTVRPGQLAYMDNALGHPRPEVAIDIYPTVVEDVLNIDISESPAGRVTVSIFNSVGRIVIGQLLHKGANEVDARSLTEGEYVAVVREGGVYRSKLRFEVR